MYVYIRCTKAYMPTLIHEEAFHDKVGSAFLCLTWSFDVYNLRKMSLEMGNQCQLSLISHDFRGPLHTTNKAFP